MKKNFKCFSLAATAILMVTLSMFSVADHITDHPRACSPFPECTFYKATPSNNVITADAVVTAEPLSLDNTDLTANTGDLEPDIRHRHNHSLSDSHGQRNVDESFGVDEPRVTPPKK